MPLMQQRHFEYLADHVAPLMPWPSFIVAMAEELKATNPKFNKEKFLKRAVAAWELANPAEDLNDEIPY
jgi:hypothetical protein